MLGSPYMLRMSLSGAYSCRRIVQTSPQHARGSHGPLAKLRLFSATGAPDVPYAEPASASADGSTSPPPERIEQEGRPEATAAATAVVAGRTLPAAAMVPAFGVIGRVLGDRLAPRSDHLAHQRVVLRLVQEPGARIAAGRLPAGDHAARRIVEPAVRRDVEPETGEPIAGELGTRVSFVVHFPSPDHSAILTTYNVRRHIFGWK